MKELIWRPDLSDLERIRLASTMDGGEKLSIGLRLFEEECRLIEIEIREQHPDAGEEEVQRRIRQQIDEIHPGSL